MKRYCGQHYHDLVLHSSNNKLSLQFHSDDNLNRAGFLASWTQVSKEINNSVPSLDLEKNYILTFPKNFLIGADTTPEEVCLQTLNMKNDGKVTISLYEKDAIIKTIGILILF